MSNFDVRFLEPAKDFIDNLEENMKGKMKTYTIEEITDKHIGKRGTSERDRFDFELKLDILGEMIKRIRLEKQLTQEQLGKLIGVQKAQISKIENNTKDVRLSTVMRVFYALKTKVRMSIEFDQDSQVELVG